MMKHNYYSELNLVVGCNKSAKQFFPNYRKLEENFNNNILIPYEFLANTYQIGKYINKLLTIGFNIHFKPRPDESIEQQLEAYEISSVVSKVNLVHELDDKFLEKIDIIAGTTSTLIYDLLPLNKIIWVFETDYKHLYDLVDQRLAHKISLDTLDILPPEIFKPTIIDSSLFFNKSSLEQTIINNLDLCRRNRGN